MRVALLMLGLLALAACEAKPVESEGDRLTRRLSERMRRPIELHYVETETGATKVTCGIAGDPVVTTRPGAIPPPPLNELIFIDEHGKLSVFEGIIIPAETEATIHARCPSLPINPVTPVSALATGPIRA